MNKLFAVLVDAVSRDSLKPYLISPKMTLSVGEVFQLSRQIAAKLREHGLNQDSRVLLQVPPELMLLTSWALIHEAIPAATQVAENPILSKFTHIISSSHVDQDLGPDIIYFSEQWLKSARATSPRISPRELTGDSVFRFFFTSNSSGKAKAMSASVDLLLARLEVAENNWLGKNSMVLLGPSDFSFWVKAISVLRSGEAFLIPTNPYSNYALAAQNSIEMLIGSSAQIVEFFEQRLSESAVYHPKSIACIDNSLPEKFAKKLMHDFDIEIFSYFGTAETGIASFKNQKHAPSNNVGHPLPGVAIEVVNDEGVEVQPGETGVIRLRTDYSVGGYLYEPSESFSDGYFYPGEIGSFETDGSLTLQNPEEESLIGDGQQRTLVEIEKKLLDFEGITEVAAFVFESDLGMDSYGVLIVTTTAFNPANDILEIQKSLGEKSPKRFVQVSRIPKMSDGSTDYTEVQRVGTP